MRIGVPRGLIVTMAAIFAAYHIVLGLYTIEIPANPLPVLAAMALYATAVTISMLPGQPERMSTWLAVTNVLVCIAMPMLIAPQLDATREGGLGYSTWYVAAVGTLMTITSTRRRHLYAWLGIAALVIQTVLWDPALLLGIGVIGSASWVAVSHILSRALAKASRDAARFARAEREATDWQAAQEAHLYERQFRLGQTGTTAVPMLRIIEESNGELTEEQRAECLHLEGAIRDEIRGRRLLDDVVRSEVMAARRRGVLVSLFDEGGLDELDEASLQRVLTTLAEAIRSTSATRVIARTAPPDSEVAVTVVGLTPSGDGRARDLGQSDDDEDDSVDLWLEIPRTAARA
ncbi:hypothetical protein [Microcella humidisoli]|uniref:Histidine kinase n=1 Tax=Microcella humidisoli TaxID=2963406 RepID=A0ABY5FXR2_9MICO|nr:hypothetical protein [Microcella humidisoli]UTT63043.1 hypothetical protein NNL39_02730 [Microcella humidisoli]